METKERLNGKYVPFTGYEDGDIWTGSYTHSERGTATQCLGFCYLIYNKIWGSDTFGTEIEQKSLLGESSDFSGIYPGAWVRCGNAWHALVILAKSSTGVTVYDCNWSASNEIDVRDYTWKDFKEEYTSIEYGYTPLSLS